MNCRKAVSLLADSISGELEGNASAQLREHLDQCPDCRAKREELHSVWSDLRTLPQPGPPEALQVRLEAAVQGFAAGQRSSGTTSPLGLRQGIHALAAVLLLAIGMVIGSRLSSDAGPNDRIAQPNMARFALLLRETRPNQETETDDQAVEEYGRWYQSLVAQGKGVLGEKLSSRRLVLPRSAESGGLPNRQEITGLFIVRAADWAEAQRIASTCPHLGSGTIELRPLE